jgi:alanine racemase
MIVDLRSIRRNWQLCAEIAGEAEIAGVVKANAYGCGLVAVARTLVDAGCRTFFVAHLHEAICLRRVASRETIYALHGLYPGAEDLYVKHRIRPVLSAMSQVIQWIRVGTVDVALPAAIHICTGMNRSGIPIDSAFADVKAAVASHRNKFDLLMSHLACADEESDCRSQRQLELFKSVAMELPCLRTSVASTAGCLKGREFHMDMVRPGIGLYGGNPISWRRNAFWPVVSVTAPVIELRKGLAGEYVGYGNDFRLQEDTMLALISIGYADGLPRRLQDTSGGSLSFYYGDVPLAVVGRVSMDLCVVAIPSRIARKIQIGEEIEIVGMQQSLDEFAHKLGTIPNEVITSFGERVDRKYSNWS